MKTFIERSYQETVANRQLRRGQTTKQQYDPLEDVFQSNSSQNDR